MTGTAASPRVGTVDGGRRRPTNAVPMAPVARGIAAAALAVVAAGTLAACGSSDGAGEADTSDPAASDAATSAPQTSTARAPEESAFVDALGESGLPDLPGSVDDTLVTLGHRACEQQADGTPRPRILDGIMPVAESVASLAPGHSAEDISSSILDAAGRTLCA